VGILRAVGVARGNRSWPTRVGAIGQFARAVEIATVLWASGFRWLVAAMGLGACVSPRCRLVCSLRPRRQCPHHVAMDVPLPVRMRLVLERLGPTFVKLGQILALRADYMPAEYAQALRALHDHVAPFDGQQARAVIEHELGAPLSHLFADFDDEPLAAASLSQVHRATLPDGRAVAVKVQRPGAEERMARDLALLRVLARRIERRRPEAIGFRPTAAVAELADTTARELDFRSEARTARQLRRAFREDERIVIPWVDRERTSRRVLTMELITGRPPAPGDVLRSEGFDVEALLHAGASAMLRQLFELGTFHADPHPGNVLFLSGDRVAFLDFGMFGRLEPRQRRRMGFVVWALVAGDFDSVADLLLPLAQPQPQADVAAFRLALAEAVEDWYDAPDRRRSVAHLLLRELAAGARHGVVFPRELMLVARALIGIDATTTLIAPELRFAELVRPLVAEVQSALLPGPRQLRDALERRRFDYLQLMLELPDLLPDLLLDRPRATAPPPNGSGTLAPVASALAAAGLGGAAVAVIARSVADAAARHRRSSTTGRRRAPWRPSS
jgi:ubiquinone biosynthesis protein